MRHVLNVMSLKPVIYYSTFVSHDTTTQMNVRNIQLETRFYPNINLKLILVVVQEEEMRVWFSSFEVSLLRTTMMYFLETAEFIVSS